MQKNKKIEEMFYRASLTPDFQDELKKYRPLFEIPSEGIKSNEDLSTWTKKGYWLNREFEYAIESLCQKLKLPISASTLMEKYLIYHETLEHWAPPDFGCEADTGSVFLRKHRISIESPVDRKWKDSEQPFVTMYISHLASLKDAQQFLASEWPYIQKTFREDGDVLKQRIRVADNKVRDEKIFILSQKSDAELDLKRSLKGGGYRDIRIAQIMQNEGIKVTAENVRKVISRQRKLRGL